MTSASSRSLISPLLLFQSVNIGGLRRQRLGRPESFQQGAVGKQSGDVGLMAPGFGAEGGRDALWMREREMTAGLQAWLSAGQFVDGEGAGGLGVDDGRGWIAS
jgi:hypothetical protein